MRLLITGGLGFIGAWTAKACVTNGIAVRLLDVSSDDTVARMVLGDTLDRTEFVQASVADSSCVADCMKDCDGVIHLAAMLAPQCRTDPVRGAEINLAGTLRVFEAASQLALSRVVYCSSAAVHGPGFGSVPAPDSHYGLFKLAMERSAQIYSRQNGLSSIGLRPHVVYGPGRLHGDSAGISQACLAAVVGEPHSIPFTGRACFVHVEELAGAFVEAALDDLPGARVFDVAGELADVTDVIAEIRRCRPDAQITCAGSGLGIATEVDAAAIYAAFPGLRSISLADGVARTIASLAGMTLPALADTPIRGAST